MIEIRDARPADAEEIARIYRPYVSDSAISFELEPPSAGIMAERLDAAGSSYPWLVAADRGAFSAMPTAGPTGAGPPTASRSRYPSISTRARGGRD
jgi:phosphinothricin acetyltransferase